jgi:amino acid transporter
MENNQDLLQNDLVIDSIAHTYLKETAKWTKFLAILGFIASGIIIIASFFVGSIFAKLNNANMSDTPNPVGAMMGAFGGTITVIYLLLGVLVFFISLFLFRFGAKMKIALQNPDQEVLNLSLKNLKNYFRIHGILAIIYLSIVALALVIIIIAAAFKH